MRNFFHGWRRKAGFVLLGLACLLCGAWVRTASMVDCISVMAKDHALAIWSLHDGNVLIVWDRRLEFPSGPPSKDSVAWDWYARTLNTMSPRYGDGSLSNVLSWVIPDESKAGYIAIHYQWLILPLTIISAYLLLVPARKRPPTVSQPHA